MLKQFITQADAQAAIVTIHRYTHTLDDNPFLVDLLLAIADVFETVVHTDKFVVQTEGYNNDAG